MQTEPSWEIKEAMAQTTSTANFELTSAKHSGSGLAIPLASFMLVLISVFYLVWFENSTRVQHHQQLAGISTQERSYKSYSMPATPAQLSFTAREASSGELLFTMDLEQAVAHLNVIDANYRVSLSSEIQELVRLVLAESVKTQRTKIGLGLRGTEQSASMVGNGLNMMKNYLLLEAMKRELINLGVPAVNIVLFSGAESNRGEGAITIKGDETTTARARPRLLMVLSQRALEYGVVYDTP